MKTKQIVIITLILVASAFLTRMVSQSEAIQPNKPFNTFPLAISDWKGEKDSLDERVYNILGVEDYILANYRNSKRDLVNLYVGFYQSQKEGDIIHSPKNCMPGAGWNIAKTSQEMVEVDGQSEPIKIIKLLLQKGGEKQIVFYWFQSRGRIISSEYMQKIWLVIDSIFKHRTDGSFVRLISPITKDENSTILRLKDFTKKVYPLLTEYIPS